MKEIKITMFSEGQYNAHNILAQTLVNAAGAKDLKDNEKIYDFLENTPKTTLIARLVDALQDLGCTIKPIKSKPEIEIGIIENNLEVSKKNLAKLKKKIKKLEKG